MKLELFPVRIQMAVQEVPLCLDLETHLEARRTHSGSAV